MLRNICLVLALLVVSGAGWAQENQNNTPEARACRGDAHRFCAKEIGDEFRVASCLQDHRSRLSRACRTVLEGHGM